MNRFGNRYVSVGGHMIPAHMLQAYNFVVQWSKGNTNLMLLWLYRVGELWHRDMTADQLAEQVAYDILKFCTGALSDQDQKRGGVSAELLCLTRVVRHLEDLKWMNE